MATRVLLYDIATGQNPGLAGSSNNDTVLWNSATQSWGAGAIPYDLAGSVSGTPTVNDTVFALITPRAFTLAATGHQAYCNSQPSASTVFDIKKNGASIGSITFTSAGVTGTVSITSGLATSFAVGDRLTVIAPANLNGIVSPYWGFLATVA